MKANEVRKMSAAELESKLVDLKKDLFNLRLQHATNQLDNPIRIAQVIILFLVSSAAIRSASESTRKTL